MSRRAMRGTPDPAPVVPSPPTTPTPPPGAPPAPSRLRAADVGALAVDGVRSRPGRAALSAAGIALGVATVVAVLGISASSRAQLVAEIDTLGTNLVTVSASSTYTASAVRLPGHAGAMAARIGPVLADSAVGTVNAPVYRNDRVPAADTNALSVREVQPNLLATLGGRLAAGRFLNRATARLPAVVLGATAASVLGIDRTATTEVWLGHRWFAVVGILRPLALAPDLDRSALVGFPAAERLLRAPAHPNELLVRVDPANVAAVSSVLAATVDPAAPQDVALTNPTDALVARADASSSLETVFIGLGAVALVVGGIGIANIMVIAVLERRGEIGVRRALGATRRHIAAQFVAESCLLAVTGGIVGALVGGFATTVWSAVRHWPATVPLVGLAAAVCAGVLVGVAAGLYPAAKAAKAPPADALRDA